MKNKLFITIVFVVAIFLSIGIGIIAFGTQSSVMGRMERFSEIEVVEEVNVSSTQSRTVTNNEIITNQNKVKNYMKENQLIKNDESDYKIQLITNNVTDEKYFRMIGSGATIDIIQKTGEIRRYINANPDDFILGTSYAKDKTENIAKKIMESNELLQANKNYELKEIKENSNYFPTACFKDSINNKMLYMIFNPDNEEIAIIITKAIPVSENNEVKIDEETAKNIALNKVNLLDKNILKVEQKEVIPNSMFLEAGYYYSDINIKRNAYVISFDTISKLQVFVDATTGEILGGDGIW